MRRGAAPRLLAAAPTPAVPQQHCHVPSPTADLRAAAQCHHQRNPTDLAAHVQLYGYKRCASAAEAAAAALHCKLAHHRHSLQDKASAVTASSHSVALSSSLHLDIHTVNIWAEAHRSGQCQRLLQRHELQRLLLGRHLPGRQRRCHPNVEAAGVYELPTKPMLTPCAP